MPYALQGNLSGGSFSSAGLYDFNMGFKFTPTKDGKITKIGGYLYSTQTVKLYNSAFALLASASVTGNQNWAYVSITPVPIVATASYYIVVGLSNLMGMNYSPISLPRTHGNIKIDYCCYQSGGAGAFMSGFYTTTSTLYGTPDFEVSYNTPPSVNVGGAWKTVNNTYVNVNGVWKPVSDIYVNVGGVWKTV